MLVATWYWYNEATNSNLELAKLIKENSELKAEQKGKTLREFVDRKRVTLSDLMNDRFDRDEVEKMAFDLNVEKDWGDAISKAKLVRLVLEYLKNRNRLSEVDEWISIYRVDIENEE